MKYWVKLLVFIALAISIPLQGMAAATMPICNDSFLPVSNTHVNHEANHAVKIEMSNDCQTEASSNCTDVSCQDCSNMKCSLCHINLFQLPNTSSTVITDSYNTTYPELTIRPYQFFILPLLHPPKQTLS
jgi:hypothetical protein